MEQHKHAGLARAFYAALGAGDRAQLDALLHPEFTGRTAEAADHDCMVKTIRKRATRMQT
jgi:ketosteroid isomerase-like protein